MSRALRTHVVAGKQENVAGHRQLVSAGIGDVKNDLAPADAVACMLSAKTGNCRVTFDGVDPTAAYGLVIVAGAQPVYMPVGRRNVRATAGAADDGQSNERTLKSAGDGVAGTLDVLWLA